MKVSAIHIVSLSTAGSYKIYTVYNIMSTITFTLYQLSVTVTAADRGRLTALHDWWQWLFSSCRGKLSVNHRYPLISTISIEALINTGYAYLWQIASTMALLHSSEVQPHVCCHPLMTHVKPYAKSYLFWTMFLYFIWLLLNEINKWAIIQAVSPCNVIMIAKDYLWTCALTRAAMFSLSVALLLKSMFKLAAWAH